jgi:MYXO-CTERM domain-containing protein
VRISSGVLAQNVDVRVTDANPSSFLVSPETLELDEGDSATLAVKLTQPPETELTVTTSVVGDEAHLRVTEGAELAFKPRVWNVAQTVALEAPQDDDAKDDEVVVRLTGRGPVQSREIVVVIHDDDPPTVGGAGGATSSAGGETAVPNNQAGEPTALQGDAGRGPDMAGGGVAGEHVPDPANAGQNAQGDGGAPGVSPTSHSDKGCGCALPGAADDTPGGLLALLGLLGIGSRALRRQFGRVRQRRGDGGARPAA